MNSIIQSLYERKSVRAFTDQELSEEDVQTILSAAVQAPTAGNQQLYTILRITDSKMKHSLSISCDNQPFIEQAKLVLVFCADCLKWYNAFTEAGCEPRLPEEGDLMLAVCDTMVAVQNAVTAASSLGIGCCYIGDIMEHYETQKGLFNLPRYVFPVAMVVFGYPTQQQMNREKPKRVDMKYIVNENTYHKLTPDETRKMFSVKLNNQSYEEWIKAFCNRKYNSDFSREMSRSVRRYLEDYKTN